MAKKILVIDDSAPMREVIEKILITHGFDVLLHDNGNGIPEIIKRYSPDLILMDIRLRDGSLGTEICKKLKQKIKTPIVLLSTHHSSQISYKDYGADDFIEKPFDLDHFKTTINTHLSKSDDVVIEV